MNILETIDFINEDKLNESGIRNISKIVKKYKKSIGYFHMDLDGVASFLGMKEYLKSKYRLKTIAAHPIQYGSQEYTVPKGDPDALLWLCDFAHGKPMFTIHVDHHDSQVGVETGSVNFKHSPSGTGTISAEISPREIFPPKDLKIINTVDSADFASQDLTPDDIIRATFGLDKTISVEDNHRMMGLVVNKLLLTYKNKKGFLSKLAMNAKPSLISMYNTIVKLAKEEGYNPPEQIETDTKEYQKKQRSKIKEGGLSIVKSLKNGESTMVGNLIVQYGGGYMGKGNTYDRYTPFKIHPEANYYTIAWPMGLVQLSKNPFKKSEKDLHLGNILLKEIMPSKFKSKLEKIDITLDTIKHDFEMDIMKKGIKDAVGFTLKDLIVLFDKKIKGLPDSGSYKNLISDIASKPYDKLSYKQKEIMKRVTINAWDLIIASSGGHKSITQASGLSFIKKDQWPGGYTSLMKDIQYEIAKRMKDE